MTRETRVALLLERDCRTARECEIAEEVGGMSEDPFGFAPDLKYYYLSALT